MLRRFAQGRTSFAAVDVARSIEQTGLRRDGARPLAAIGRIVGAPFVLLGAALAGAVFVLLLPICGIASIAEGIARLCWRSFRESFAVLRRGVLSQQ